MLQIKKSWLFSLIIFLRNQEGLVTVSLSELIQLSSTVIEVEALAARRAVELSLELGFDNIVLEGDSEILIKVLKNSSYSLAPFGQIVNDIFCLASNVVNTVPVLAGMYRTGMYINIKTPTFYTGLNTGRTGQFWAISAGTEFFFLIFFLVL